MKLGLIITAGGTGKRIGGVIPKQFHTISGKPIILQTIENILKALKFDAIVVTYPLEFLKLITELLESGNYPDIDLVEGGEERFHSVWNALQTHQIQQTDIVFIHDAVRPFVSKNLMIRIYENVLKYNAVAPGVKIKDTVKEIDNDSFIIHTIDREKLVAIQTPQAYKTTLLTEAYKKALQDGKTFTDEAGILEYYGERVKLVEGDEKNIKITTPDDLILASYLATAE
jgi:2-C-methyl-D-erythritol 4-phosphate cytidylyltransferase